MPKYRMNLYNKKFTESIIISILSVRCIYYPVVTKLVISNHRHRTDLHIGNFIYIVGKCKQEANLNLFINYCTI